MGACIKSLVSQGLSREEIFIATKHGYVPDDAENGISASFLVD
jgi:aryl-alcohol dehydrogenase-like predicted oxidoreductase